MKRFLSSILLSFLIGNAWGHAVWIQTAPTGHQGQKQAVRISYSEPGETPEKPADWYSDVKAFDLWLIDPVGQKTKLSVTSAIDHYTAEFIPKYDGVYTLAIGHTAKDLGGTTQYQFNATATVVVGKSRAMIPASPNELNVAVIQPGNDFKIGQKVSLAGVFKTQPAEKLRIEIHSPSGWNRTLETNANGLAEFTPLWSGTYYIEASKSEKESGEQNGKPFKSVWRCATYVLNVR